MRSESGPGRERLIAKIHRRRRQRNDAVFFADCERRWYGLFRRFSRGLPSSPHCRLCFIPLRGFGPILGWRPSRYNPNYCDSCFERMPVGGYEMEVGVLFADVRGFTSLAERTPPNELADLLNRFYAVATEALTDHDAIIDKLVGDEVMALFLPQLRGLKERTCEVMVGAADALLRRVGFGLGQEPWLRLGVGLHYGPAVVGNVGAGERKDFTAIGDVVNTAHRLQEHAQAGQILLSESVYERVATRYPDVPTLKLQVKGKIEPVNARLLVPE